MPVQSSVFHDSDQNQEDRTQPKVTEVSREDEEVRSEEVGELRWGAPELEGQLLVTVALSPNSRFHWPENSHFPWRPDNATNT